MTNRRVLIALAAVCLTGQISAPGLHAQTLGAAAAAAARQRKASKPHARKVYTEADLAGRTPEDPARAAEAKKLDARYDALLARLQALDVKMKQDANAVRSAEFELKVFKLDMANRNKYEKRQQLEKELARRKAVVQQNLVVLEQLRAEQRVLDAELARLQEPR